MITYHPNSQQSRYDDISRCSYLASKEGDVAYDEQHSILLKPKQLLLRTLHITTSVDLIFFKDINISLLSDPLAFKFKESCANFRLQNGQIEVPHFQTPNSKILDPKFPDFMKSNSQIHRSHEGKRPQDDIDLRFKFKDGLLYYQGLLYISNGPYQL